MLRIAVRFCILATVLTSLFAQQRPPQQQRPPMPASAKKRIAVLNFEYGTVASDVASIFGGNQDVGRGVADLLVGRLVQSGVYSVIERKALDKVMAEQNLSNSDRADPNSAAKIGKILGVDAIVVGSITQFGRDDRNTDIGGGALGGITSRYGLGGVGRKKAKAMVVLTARLVNTDTAEVLAMASGKGESQRTGATLAGAGGSVLGSAVGAVDMTSRNFSDTIIGEAVTQAVAELARDIDQDSNRITAHVVTIDGLVADVNNGTLVINLGSRSGLRVGDRLKVMRVGRPIKDPVTGRTIRRVEDEVGTAVITDIDEQSAGARFSGPGTPQVGDRVKQ